MRGLPVRLPKKRRISQSRDFRRVREEGKSYRGRHLILGVLADGSLRDIKVGFVTGKRLGPAVVRNRVRRRLRAILVEEGDRVLPGHYLVTVAKVPAVEASFEALKREWIWLGQRAGIFAPASAGSA